MTIPMNHISFDPPELTPVMNPYMVLAVGFFTISPAMPAAYDGAATLALMHATIRRTKNLAPDFADASHPDLVIDSVPK